jgi:hypothetical protein
MIFDPKHFTVVEFFSYPCSVINRTATYEERGIGGTHGDKSVKEFFEAVLAEARKITGKHLMDNKIAFKVVNNDTKSTFYVGYKDNIWCFGPALHPYMNSCYTLKMSDYVK